MCILKKFDFNQRNGSRGFCGSFDFSVVDTVFPLLGIVLADDARGIALPQSA